jgi:AcrR family transcriptional regulator
LKQLFDFYMQNIDNKTEQNQDPRERLLDAAEKLFCLRGYEGTSIRDITAEAGCNIAAVNYHFNGKDQLYQEMFRRRLVRNLEVHHDTIERICSAANPTLEDLLTELIRPIVKSAEQQDPWTRVIRLMVREALHQRIDVNMILGEMKKLFVDRLARAFMQMLPQVEERKARQAVFSVESMILHSILFLEHYTFFLPGLTTDEIVEQMVRFAAAGIRSIAEGRKECGD